MRLYVASTVVAWSELVNNRCHFDVILEKIVWRRPLRHMAEVILQKVAHMKEIICMLKISC